MKEGEWSGDLYGSGDEDETGEVLDLLLELRAQLLLLLQLPQQHVVPLLHLSVQPIST